MTDICTTCGAPIESGGAKGLCSKHYKRQRAGKPLDDPERAPRGEGTQFAIRCSTDQLKAWKKAAKATEQAFRDWIRNTLDEASR